MIEMRTKEKQKLIDEKKHMEDLLRQDKEKRFGKKFDVVEQKKKEET